METTTEFNAGCNKKKEKRLAHFMYIGLLNQRQEKSGVEAEMAGKSGYDPL